MSKKIEFHPLCDIFPVMPDDEFRELCEDISAHGVLHPVVLYDGKILDGRNRWTAALKVGRKCPMIQYRGEMTAAEFVIAMNVNRRHLTASQRAAMVAQAWKFAKENSVPLAVNARSSNPKSSVPIPFSSKPTQAAMAKAAGVSAGQVKKAAAIGAKSPEKLAEVAAGKVSLDAAMDALNSAPEPKAEPPKRPLDKIGKEIEVDALIPILTETEFAELLKELDAIGRKVHKLRDTLRGRHIAQSAEIDLRNAREAIAFAQPWTECPLCKIGDGKMCKACGNGSGHAKPPQCGWLPRGIYDSCVPKALK